MARPAGPLLAYPASLGRAALPSTGGWTRSSTLWDSGANAHLTSDLSLFVGHVREVCQKAHGIANDVALTGVGRGVAMVRGHLTRFKKLYYVPDPGAGGNFDFRECSR